MEDLSNKTSKMDIDDTLSMEPNPNPFTRPLTPLTPRTAEDIGEMLRDIDYEDSRWETNAYHDGEKPKGTGHQSKKKKGGRRKKKKRKTTRAVE